MSNKSSKFHFVIDFGEDLTLEQAEQHLESALAQIRHLSSLKPIFGTMKIEEVGIVTDRVLQVYLPQKDFELLHKRAEHEGDYLGSVARKIIQKSLSEGGKEEIKNERKI